MKRIAIFLFVLLLSLSVAVVIVASVMFRPLGDLDDFQNPMLNASRDGDTAEIQRLLTDGSDINTSDAFNNTPLSIAAHFGQTEAAEMLIRNGAEINGIEGAMSPVQCAVYRGHSAAVALLLREGADPNVADKSGTTPLSTTDRKGDTAMVKALLDAGSNIEVANNRGWRPLHVALRSTQTSDTDRLAAVKVLLEYGADPNAVNAGGSENDFKHDSHVGYRRSLPNKGNTPLSIANSNGFSEIVALLKAHGGT